MRSHHSTLVLLAVLTALVAASGAATATTASSHSTAPSTADIDQRLQQSECDADTIVHDAFLDDQDLINETTSTGNGTSSTDNTQVRIEDDDAFVRVQVENPNAYCVTVEVRISEEIVSPAELGQVESNDGNYSAGWHEYANFDRDTVFTKVEVTLPAQSSATFAPSKPTIVTAAYRDEKARGIEQFIGNISLFGDDDPDLKQRTHVISANESSSGYVAVELSNESADASVDEWQAVYRLSEDAPWRPIDEDSGDPVFYRKSDDGEIQLVFNERAIEQNATVRLTMEPTITEVIMFDVRSMRRSIYDVRTSIFGSAVILPTSLPGVAGDAVASLLALGATPRRRRRPDPQEVR